MKELNVTAIAAALENLARACEPLTNLDGAGADHEIYVMVALTGEFSKVGSDYEDALRQVETILRHRTGLTCDVVMDGLEGTVSLTVLPIKMRMENTDNATNDCC